MMGNRKEPGFRATNGELTTVRSVERGIINLEDGRSVPANYREFTHGYAVTAHRSQGKTVDHVIVSADVMKQELFYVAASRGREGISIVTSDVERLGESLGVSMARPPEDIAAAGTFGAHHRLPCWQAMEIPSS